jgi:hypothetical protein
MENNAVRGSRVAEPLRSHPLSNSPDHSEWGTRAGTGAPPYDPLNLGGGATKPSAKNMDAPAGSPLGATFIGEHPFELLDHGRPVSPSPVDGVASTEGAGTLPIVPAGTAQDGALGPPVMGNNGVDDGAMLFFGVPSLNAWFWSVYSVCVFIWC